MIKIAVSHDAHADRIRGRQHYRRSWALTDDEALAMVAAALNDPAWEYVGIERHGGEPDAGACR